MKKKYRVEVDCANCAAKMEEAIKKIDGVSDASVSFLTQKLTIDLDESRADEIMEEAVKRCRRVDADSVIYLK